MGSKRDRQNSILELVRRNRIESQQALAEALHRSGTEVSQATLSRDIQELALVKVGNAYVAGRPEARRTPEQTLRRILRNYVVGIDSVPPLLVLKTTAGSASTVADAIDNAGWTEIVGTIAGDDTIFVLCRSADDLKETLNRTEDLRA
jgi:transcriptional regulator of arginine metabolism